MAQAELGGDGVVNSVAVGVDASFLGDGVGGFVVAEHVEQALGAAASVPTEVTGEGDGIAVGP